VAAAARLAELTDVAEEKASVTPLAPGMFSVDLGGKREIVYVAGPPTDQWAFWNGHVFHVEGVPEPLPQSEPGHRRARVAQTLSAPMPATVIAVLVAAGNRVKKGETVVLLEAMKMELPIRSLSDGTIAAVRCREGELVTAGQVLIEMQ
jgi:biotin carboxyl carrier protein